MKIEEFLENINKRIKEDPDYDKEDYKQVLLF